MNVKWLKGLKWPERLKWPGGVTWLGVGAMASLLGAVVLAALLVLNGFPNIGGDNGVPNPSTSVISLDGTKNLPAPTDEKLKQPVTPPQQPTPALPVPAAGPPPLDNPTVDQYGDVLRRIEGSIGTAASPGD